MILNPLHKEDPENARRSFIRKSIAAVFGAAILTSADDIFSMESKTGYVYVKQNGEVINNYQPMGDSQPYVGQINIFAFSFAPTGWARCNGQLLPLTGNTALYALLGTTYGGNGSSNFALPDFQGRVPLHAGEGPGLTPYALGESGGQEGTVLLNTEIPSHTHSISVSSGIGSTPNPSNAFLAQNAEGIGSYAASPNLFMNSAAVSITGASAAHNNMQPVLSLNFCIARQGIFPTRP